MSPSNTDIGERVLEPPATRMTGGEAVARTLVALGVKHVFGIVSVHNLPIFDALAHSDAISIVPVRHEQGAVQAADGYARSTGELGVALVSTGPGTANAMGGLFEAAHASSPVLLVTGQVPSLYYGKRRGALHEADSQVAMLRSVCRRVASVRRTEDIPAILAEVATDMLTGRRAPGAIEIPIDLQYREVLLARPSPLKIRPVGPDQAAIDNAASLLRLAANPLIYAGGGSVAAGASKAILDLANTLGAPVLTTVNGRGILPEDNVLCLGPLPSRSPELREILEAADVMLAVGTRFQALATRFWTLPMPRQMIHLDVDPTVVGLSYKADVPLIGDARIGLEMLKDALGVEGRGAEFAEWARLRRDTARAAIRKQIGPDHEAIVDILRELLPTDANIVRDATVPAYLWGDRLLPILEPRTSISPTSGAIGPGLPFAIGAAVGTGRRTLVIQGDGGLMLSVGELATLAELQAPVLVCVFNDGGYGILRAVEDRRFGRQSGTDLVTPNFVDLARAFGLEAERVADLQVFRASVERAVARNGPTLLDIDLRAFQQLDLGEIGSD